MVNSVFIRPNNNLRNVITKNVIMKIAYMITSPNGRRRKFINPNTFQHLTANLVNNPANPNVFTVRKGNYGWQAVKDPYFGGNLHRSRTKLVALSGGYHTARRLLNRENANEKRKMNSILKKAKEVGENIARRRRTQIPKTPLMNSPPALAGRRVREAMARARRGENSPIRPRSLF